MAKANTLEKPAEAAEAAPGAAKAPAKAPAKVRQLAVIDTTCTTEHDGSGATLKTWRVHTVLVDGREVAVKFKYGAATLVLFAVGMKFLKWPEFDVRDPESGARLDSIPDPLKRSIGQGEELAADQIIARLDELTLNALLMRSASLDGGERYGTNSSKDEVVAFLLEKTRQRAKQAAAAIEAGKPKPMDEATDPRAGDTLGGDDFDRMFPGVEE